MKKVVKDGKNKMQKIIKLIFNNYLNLIIF